MGVAIFGLNGAGKSTLAHALAKELNFYEMDVEDYYFPEQRNSRKQALEQAEVIDTGSADELPYSNSRSKAEVPLALRLERIQQREEKRFGARTLPGGDMYEQQKEFRKVVAGREEKSLEECVQKLKCPVVVLDGTLPVEDNFKKIVTYLHRKKADI